MSQRPKIKIAKRVIRATGDESAVAVAAEPAETASPAPATPTDAGDAVAVEVDTDTGNDSDDGVAEIEAQMNRDAARRREDAAAAEPEFSPLSCSLPPAPPIPVEAFGERMVHWARALQKLSRAPLSMSLVALLGCVNLAVQGRFSIMAFGSPIPVSLYLLIIGSSGSGKSSLYRKLLAPVMRFQQELVANYERQRAILMADKDTRGEADDLIRPYLTFSETTSAALAFFLTKCRGAIGLFNDEAAVFLGGHSLKSDSHQEMIGYLSNLNDAMPITIFRKAEGAIHVSRKCLGILLMGQWLVARGFIENRMNRQQGILSRFLMCYPDSEIGSRSYRFQMETADALEAVKGYDAFMTHWLTQPLPVAEGTLNDLEPKALEMTVEAEQCFAQYCNEVEALMGRLSKTREEALDVLNKLPQMALRIGLTLQLAEGNESQCLEAAFVQRGVEIARFFGAEALRLTYAPPQDRYLEPANALLTWMKEKGMTEFTRDIYYRNAPHNIRPKQMLDQILPVLVSNGWIIESDMPKRQGVAKARKVCRLTLAAMRELGMRVR